VIPGNADNAPACYGKKTAHRHGIPGRDLNATRYI
jgi:hypothetical protein